MKSYLLKVFVSGLTKRDEKAILELRDYCRKQIKDPFELVVIDVAKQPNLAEESKIVAVPTIIKELPKPVRSVVGDFTDIKQVIIELQLDVPNL